MTKAFLPEWSVTAYGMTYRGLYRFYTDQDWHMICEKKVPVNFPTASQALAAAKAHVERALNPPIRVGHMEHGADILGIEEWRQKKAQEAEEEREKVFGAVVAKGRVIPVERKRRRA